MREYVVLRQDPASLPADLVTVGRYMAPDAHAAVAAAHVAVERQEPESLPGGTYIAVALRNWVEVQVERRNDPRLFVDGREVEVPHD